MTKNYASRHLGEDGTLACQCWCTATIQHVPAVKVRKGVTMSCGVECYRGCKPCPPVEPTQLRKGRVATRLRPR